MPGSIGPAKEVSISEVPSASIRPETRQKQVLAASRRVSRQQSSTVYPAYCSRHVVVSARAVCCIAVRPWVSSGGGSEDLLGLCEGEVGVGDSLQG